MDDNNTYYIVMFIADLIVSCSICIWMLAFIFLICENLILDKIRPRHNRGRSISSKAGY